MKVIMFKPELHYEELSGWFKSHGWGEGVPVVTLPKDSGYLVQDEDGTLIACTFIYFSNSPLCWQEWTMTNPSAKLRKRHQAIKKLIEYVQWLVKEINPASQVITLLASRSLTKMFKDAGYKVTESASMVHWA